VGCKWLVVAFLLLTAITNPAHSSQPYVAKMRAELLGADSPLDHNVESVLPGVHSRLSSMQNEISHVRGDVASNFGRITVAINDVKSLLGARDTELAAHLLQLASRLCPQPGSSPPIPTTRPPTVVVGRLQEEGTEATGSTGDLMTMPRGHHLRPKHTTIYTMYHEWFGLEDFGEIPVSGGIDFCERQWKSKWRRHFNAAEKQHFSRFKAIIMGIEAKKERDGVDLEVALEEFDAIFGGPEVKKSTANMARWLKQDENGYIAKKRKRGKASVESS
jgi:hypothetical protein